MKKSIIILSLVITLNSAFSQKIPSVVSTVDLNRYIGTWYEIARLPNFFERKLKCITATYSFGKDGKIKVLNGGHYISDPAEISTATGVAWIPDKDTPAKLKVQFFWPFSGDYWIMYLEKDYRYVLVGEPGYKYLWILAREKRLDESTYNMLLQKAIDNGYDVKPIIKVDQGCN